MGVSSCRFSLKAINLTPCFNWLPGGFVSYVQVGWRCSKLSLSLCKIFTWKPAEIKDRKYSEFSRTNPYLYQPVNHWNEFQHWLTKWSIRTPKIETEIYHNIPQFVGMYIFHHISIFLDVPKKPWYHHDFPNKKVMAKSAPCCLDWFTSIRWIYLIPMDHSHDKDDDEGYGIHLVIITDHAGCCVNGTCWKLKNVERCWKGSWTCLFAWLMSSHDACSPSSLPFFSGIFETAFWCNYLSSSYVTNMLPSQPPTEQALGAETNWSSWKCNHLAWDSRSRHVEQLHLRAGSEIIAAACVAHCESCTLGIAIAGPPS